MRKNLEERQAAMRERLAREASGAQMRPVQSVHPVEGFERPYTVREIAKMTGFSAQTVIRIFSLERGVFIYQEDRPRKRASYRSIRVPRHVYRRVMQKFTVA